MGFVYKATLQEYKYNVSQSRHGRQHFQERKKIGQQVLGGLAGAGKMQDMAR